MVNMANRKISLPDQRDYNLSYLLAYKLASEKLINLDDVVRQSENSESICRISSFLHEIQIKYLNRTYLVSLPDIDVTLMNRFEKVDLRDKILILDYLTRAKGTQLTRIPVSFQEFHEGKVYYPTFFKRGIKPLIEYFGNRPEELLKTAAELGGVKADYGDVAVTIPVFNRVPVTLVLWKGDDEFPPNASILFDSTIQDYLSVEDIVMVCQMITWKLVHSILEKFKNN